MTGTRKLQLIQLDMLVHIDSICRAHNIPYYLIGGTLIGAVRHQGFIPWDDDIDIAMHREDYEQFLKICETAVDREKYFLQTADTDARYRLIYARLRREGTLYVREGYEHIDMHHGIFIDIFPLDKTPTTKFWRPVFKLIIQFSKTALWSPVGAVSETDRIKRYYYKMLSLLPKCAMLTVIKVATGLCSEDVHESLGSPMYGKLQLETATSSEVHSLRKMRYHATIELLFEGHMFLAPVNYHDILTLRYQGDYMELPPLEQRKGTHIATTIDFGDGIVLDRI